MPGGARPARSRPGSDPGPARRRPARRHPPRGGAYAPACRRSPRRRSHGPPSRRARGWRGSFRTRLSCKPEPTRNPGWSGGRRAHRQRLDSGRPGRRSRRRSGGGELRRAARATSGCRVPSDIPPSPSAGALTGSAPNEPRSAFVAPTRHEPPSRGRARRVTLQAALERPPSVSPPWASVLPAAPAAATAIIQRRDVPFQTRGVYDPDSPSFLAAGCHAARRTCGVQFPDRSARRRRRSRDHPHRSRRPKYGSPVWRYRRLGFSLLNAVRT